MDVFEAIRTRRSVRRFTDQPVEDGKLRDILEAVRHSPSWANSQSWRFVVVRDPLERQKLGELSYVESFFAPLGYKTNPAAKGLNEAPVIIVLCADPGQSGRIRGQEYYLVDAGIAAQTMMLASHALGLGTVFVGVYDEDRIKGNLNIPQNVRVVGLFPLGYPMQKKGEGPPRKDIEELVYYNQWGW